MLSTSPENSVLRQINQFKTEISQQQLNDLKATLFFKKFFFLLSRFFFKTAFIRMCASTSTATTQTTTTTTTTTTSTTLSVDISRLFYFHFYLFHRKKKCGSEKLELAGPRSIFGLSLDESSNYILKMLTSLCL